MGRWIFKVARWTWLVPAALVLACLPLLAATFATNSATVAAPAGVIDAVGGCNTNNPPDCTGNNASSATVNVWATTVAKSSTPANGSTVLAGQTISYTLTATVTGPNTTAPVTFTDTLGAGLTFGSVTAPGVFTAGGSGQVRTFTLPAGTSAGTYAVTYTATVNAGATGTVGNSVSGGAGCTTVGACTTSHTVGSVGVSKALTSESGSQAGIAEGGETLTYTITLSNPSATAVSNFNLTDTLSAGLTYVSSSAGGVNAGQTTTWTTLSIPANGTSTVTVTASVNAPISTASVSNLAKPTGQPDPACPSTACVVTPTTSTVTVAKSSAPANGSTVLAGQTLSYTASVNAPISTASVSNLAKPTGQADPACPSAACVVTPTTSTVTVAKSSAPANGSTVLVGQTLNYTLTATVTGAATAAPTVFTDTLGAGLTFGSVTSPGVFTAGGTGQTRTFTLPAGTVAGTYAVTYTATVNAGATGSLGNSVAGGAGCTTVGACTTSHTVGSVSVSKALTSESGSQAGIAEAGETLTYTITLSNPSATAISNFMGGNLTNTAAIAVPSGLFDFNTANNTASDTDSNRPIVILRKTTTGGAGGPFGFTLTNTGQTAGTVTTTAADTPTQVDGDGAAGVQPFVVTTAGGSVAITEGSLPGNWTLSTATCVNAASAVVGSLSGTTYTIPGSATANGAVITCTFTNQAQTRLRLRKALPDGRLNAGDQFVLTIAGAGGPASATTTGNTTSPTEEALLAAATPGTAYTLSEADSGGANLASYVSTYSCTNALAGGQTPSGSGTSFNVTPVAGDDLSCVFTNAWPRADLSVTKTASPAAVEAGGLVAFTLTVFNAGPNAANGAVLRDAPGAGLDCAEVGLAAPTCVASGGAACPGGLTNAALLGVTGVAIPALPSGGGVAVTLQCRVTASGLP
ncbi:isopeptide-forming domain-containing fimbrial protein [Hydrogenophaga sp.]